MRFYSHFPVLIVFLLMGLSAASGYGQDKAEERYCGRILVGATDDGAPNVAKDRKLREAIDDNCIKEIGILIEAGADVNGNGVLKNNVPVWIEALVEANQEALEAMLLRISFYAMGAQYDGLMGTHAEWDPANAAMIAIENAPNFGTALAEIKLLARAGEPVAAPNKNGFDAMTAAAGRCAADAGVDGQDLLRFLLQEQENDLKAGKSHDAGNGERFTKPLKAAMEQNQKGGRCGKTIMGLKKLSQPKPKPNNVEQPVPNRLPGDSKPDPNLPKNGAVEWWSD